MATISTTTDQNVSATIVAAAVAKLPPRARERYRKFAAAHRHANIAKQAAFENVQAVAKRKGEVEFELAHVEHTYSSGAYEGSSEPWRQRIAELERDIETAKAELAEAQAEMAATAAPYPIHAIDSWLASNAGRKFKAATPSIPKGLTLEKARARLREIGEEIETVAMARLPAKDAIERATQEIDDIARKGRPYYGRVRLVEPNERGGFTLGTIRWPLRYNDNGDPKIDTQALVIAVLRDQLVAQAKSEIERITAEEADEFETLTLTERKTRIAELKAEALALEYQEGALLGDAASRHGMHVGALLQVEVDRTPSKHGEPDHDAPPSPEDESRIRRRERLRDPSASSDGEAERKHRERLAKKTVRSDREDSEFG